MVNAVIIQLCSYFLNIQIEGQLAHAWLRVGGPSILIGRSYYCWFFHGMSCCGYGKIMAHWTGGTPRIRSYFDGAQHTRSKTWIRRLNPEDFGDFMAKYLFGSVFFQCYLSAC